MPVLIVLGIVAVACIVFKAGYEAGYSDGWYKAKEDAKVVSIRRQWPGCFS